ncbi:MAG: hypothetical protein CFE31_18330 [Rhizobiales bacterium PAR1]|nr:MAG: hypothetical protein CFE31_18330 [Rhizobiales bacterium PAR1]
MLLFETRIPADLLALSALRKDVSDRLISLCPNPSVKNAILLTIAEMGANAIRHSNPPPSYLAARMSLDGVNIVLEIEDDGGPFDAFGQKASEAQTLDMASMAEGGRGLSIIQSLLDEVCYEPGPPNRFIGVRALGHARPALLVVEDSPILLETYCAMLAGEYRILKAGTLEAAIDLTKNERVDGIVTDLHLEGREGSELVDILEGETDRPPVPVLVITADKDPDAIRRVSMAGVEQVLNKPVSAQVLRNAVAAMLARNARQNARVFRYFGGSIDQDGEDRLPRQVGPFRLAALSARAGFGRGDFLCPLRIAGGKRLVLADVMGHGLAAQLAGMQFRAALRGIHGAQPGLSCGDFVSAMSRALCHEPILPGSFLTMIVIDLFEDGRAEISGAGHPRAMALSAGRVEMIESDGPLPGLIEGAEYPTIALDLVAGDRLFLPTDGIDPRAEDAGLVAPDWLTAALRTDAAAPFEDAMQTLDETIRHVLTHSPADDWTLLAIEKEDQAAG